MRVPLDAHQAGICRRPGDRPPYSAAASLHPSQADICRSGDPPELAEFIGAQTRLAAPPLIPEIVLHLSHDEPTVLWERLEQQEGGAELPPPFWAYPWAGGIALARYLLDHPDRVAGRVVLDLASGSGLVAIAAALAGAAAVTASDIDPVAIAAIGLNAAANGVAVTIEAGDLLASGPGPAAAPGEELAGPRPDLVLVGDAFYERRMARSVLAFLAEARAGGTVALIGDPGRTYLPATGLRELVSYAVPVWAGLEDDEVKLTTVWEPH